MSGDVITTFTADALEDCRVDYLVDAMEQDWVTDVPGARHHESYEEVFVERYFLIIGERICGGWGTTVATCSSACYHHRYQHHYHYTHHHREKSTSKSAMNPRHASRAVSYTHLRAHETPEHRGLRGGGG